MKRVIAALVFLCACKAHPEQWDGIPADRICTNLGRSFETCISGGKVYQCILVQGSSEIQGMTRFLCSRDTVEIKCTNIVNVETVCPTPGK